MSGDIVGERVFFGVGGGCFFMEMDICIYLVVRLSNNPGFKNGQSV